MQEEYEIEIDLRALTLYLLKKAKLIGIITALSAAIGMILAFFLLPPEYEVTTRMYVLNRGSEIEVSYSDYQISNQIIADYKVLITGENVTKEVIRKLGLDLKVEDLEEMILVDAPENTRVLQITVTDEYPHRAVSIANTVREVASEQIRTIMDAEAVNLVYEAQLPEEPTGPDKIKVTLIATVLGFVLTVVSLTLVYAMDDTIRTEEDVEQYLSVSVLGVIPADAEMGNLAKDNLTARKRGIRRSKT